MRLDLALSPAGDQVQVWLGARVIRCVCFGQAELRADELLDRAALRLGHPL
jgi:hypothetical protein